MDSEEVRIAAHPGVIFKDGPAGRRAALALVPDIWEVVKAIQEIDRSAESAIREVLNMTGAQIETARRYYAAYPDEIDGDIAVRDADSRAAEQEGQANHPSLE